MKCPCCDAEIHKRAVAVHNIIWIDGGKYYLSPRAAKLLVNLFDGPTTIRNKVVDRTNTDNVALSRIRRFFEEYKLPFTVNRIALRTYELRELNVQNNNHAQRAENVHS